MVAQLQAALFKKGSLTISDRIHMGPGPVPGARIVELPWREEMAIWHYSYHSLEDLVEKSNRYSSVEARRAGAKRNRKARPLPMLKAAAENLLRDEYIKGRGYKDGTAAPWSPCNRAYYRFLVLAKTSGTSPARATGWRTTRSPSAACWVCRPAGAPAATTGEPERADEG